MRLLPVREISEQAGSADLIARMDMALHGLCQPLTVLQCRLAIGELIGEPDAMREAIREGLQECARMNRTVGTMREMLQKVLVDSEERTR